VLSVGGLFSGIGGWELGLERAGMRIAWHCEQDAFCQRVLGRHWPDVPCYSDVRELGVGTPGVDVLCGGFPCQPVSLAGRRLAQEDERWLWPEFARVVGLLRPRHVLVENVPGLLGRGLGDVLGDLAALGYDAEWDCLPAAAFGAPHVRDRVWVVAYPASIGRGSRWERGPASGRERECESERSLPLADNARVFRETPRQRGWPVEPDVDRMAHGIPAQVDRLRSLGNALVPQVAEWIGRRVIEWERGGG
jgi:DNA (cytosine-5)-methyltransferase 1